MFISSMPRFMSYSTLAHDLYETARPHQRLVLKGQCGSLTPVGAEPGSVVTVVSEKGAYVFYDVTSDVMGNGTVLLSTSH